ncbi:RipA family octameric membrane protein [Serratia marcescens]|uniref:RipA family octameric membrane protein n=1 Tax=Serratia marcescens TaxID=615 RepID=UPI003FA6D6ED
MEKNDSDYYKEKFKINNNCACTDEKLKNAFEKISDIRKFEIEMYWKRATYFWTIIAVTFTGYFALSVAEKLENRENYLLLISSMGLVFTFAWYFVNRGSKYWQENWENHLDLIEDEITGPLYKTVLERPSKKTHSSMTETEGRFDSFLTGPSKLSVSKINQWVALYIILIWIGMVIVNLPFQPLIKNVETRMTLVSITILFISIMAITLMVSKGKSHQGKHEVSLRKRETAIINKDIQ